MEVGEVMSRYQEKESEEDSPQMQQFCIIQSGMQHMVIMHIVTQGNSDLDFALMKTIITRATIMHKQNNGFVLVLLHS